MLRITSMYPHEWPSGFSLRAGENLLDEATIPDVAMRRIRDLAKAGCATIETCADGVTKDAAAQPDPLPAVSPQAESDPPPPVTIDVSEETANRAPPDAPTRPSKRERGASRSAR